MVLNIFGFLGETCLYYDSIVLIIGLVNGAVVDLPPITPSP
jgi:hypothetical protein